MKDRDISYPTGHEFDMQILGLPALTNHGGNGGPVTQGEGSWSLEDPHRKQRDRTALDRQSSIMLALERVMKKAELVPF